MGKATKTKCGVSLIEMLVVFAIIAVLLGLILVAVQYSRESSRRTVCQSNLGQLAAALHQYIAIHKRVPDPAPTGLLGGWSIAILPFLEEENLARSLTQNPSLDPVSMSPLARQRPAILTCPSADDPESSIPAIPVGHYSLHVPNNKWQESRFVPVSRASVREGWQLRDAGYGSTPWVIGAEKNAVVSSRQFHVSGGPHSGGYNATFSNENNAVRYIH